MNPLSARNLRKFEKGYFDASRVESAESSLGAFLEAFPISRLPDLKVEEYVIGLQEPTFCAFVEAKTNDWAHIKVATAAKFGIYFGRTKSDGVARYRPTLKFRRTTETAFAAVKKALLDLVREGGKNDPDSYHEAMETGINRIFRGVSTRFLAHYSALERLIRQKFDARRLLGLLLA